MANLYLKFDADEDLEMRDEYHSINTGHFECNAEDSYGNRYDVVMDLTVLKTYVTSYATGRRISIKLVPDTVIDKYIYLTGEEYMYLIDADLSTLTDPDNPDSPTWADMI